MIDPIPLVCATRVRKRDNAVEPFNLSNLANCILGAMASTGHLAGGDGVVVRGLAEAVRDYLIETGDGAPVPTGRIADMVELVLTQTGHGDIADAIREFARNRERRRRGVLVASPRRSDGRFVQHRWKKGNLVQFLRREHGLDAPASRMIAGRVEQLIFNIGLRVVTTGLVTELSRSELLAWGLLPGALVTKRQRRPRRTQPVQDKVEPA